MQVCVHASSQFIRTPTMFSWFSLVLTKETPALLLLGKFPSRIIHGDGIVLVYVAVGVILKPRCWTTQVHAYLWHRAFCPIFGLKDLRRRGKRCLDCHPDGTA